MTRFNTRIGAAVLALLGAAYLVLSLATGRSARAEVPPDLTASAADASLDVWKGAALMAQQPNLAVVDVRPADAFARYHLPGAASAPGLDPAGLKALARSHPAVLVYAGKDEVAQKLVAEVRQGMPGAPIYFLADGARAWYLAFQLPVPLFAEASPPDGYLDSLKTVEGFFAAPASADRAKVVGALQTLARLSYQPSLLKAGKKTAAAGPKKKIAGGCG